MDQNQSVDNDLQKAIDDITNTTNVDPVFSDPVAAPSSVPEGDTGELGEAVGPFPEPVVDLNAPKKEEQLAPVDPIAVPEIKDDGANATPEPAPAPAPAPAPETVPAPEPKPEPAPEPIPEPEIALSDEAVDGLNTHQIKEAALRDLVPILGNLNISDTEKFDLYKNIFEELKDYTVLEPAYKTAKAIPDDKARAEALLYLVESIDKM